MSQSSPGAAPDTVLRFESVRKTYGEFIAVKGSSFSLKRGEILTLLGPSGCGKTTTLRMAIGLERASEGRIWFDDRLVDCVAERIFVPPEKRQMGMVFQSYAIWPHMNVFDNVAYPLKARGRPAAEIREAVHKVLDLVGLREFEQRSSTKLSGGQQQRVAVARALVFGPDLLLMDEPFSNLDAKLRDQMRTEVKLLQRRLGISVLFVTHDQSEALALSDRLAVMRGGEVEQVGEPRDLYEHPGTPAVRDFLGRTILLPATLRGGSPGEWQVTLAEGADLAVTGMNHHPDARPGAACLLGIRPEQVVVTPDGSTQGSSASHGTSAAPNTLHADILALLFLGDRYEATLRLGSGALISVLLPPAEHWREGARGSIHFPAARLQLWPAEATAA